MLEALTRGDFSNGDTERYRGLVDSLLEVDRYCLMADFAAYLTAQRAVDALFEAPEEWARRALLNVAGMGEFSTDRTIREYIERVWAPPTQG